MWKEQSGGWRYKQWSAVIYKRVHTLYFCQERILDDRMTLSNWFWETRVGSVENKLKKAEIGGRETS